MSFPRAAIGRSWPFDHPLERLNKEVKRRANVVGIFPFPNEASVKRLVGAIPCSKQNDEWQLQHRYMTLETMTGLSDDPIGSLPNYAHQGSLTGEPMTTHENHTTLTDVTRRKFRPTCKRPWTISQEQPPSSRH